MPGNLVRGFQPNHALAVLTLAVLTASAFVTLIVVPSATGAAPAAPAPAADAGHQGVLMFDDDFTRDKSLNETVWQLNGPTGSLFGPDDVGSSCQLIAPSPTFSSAGMGIAETSNRCEASTIQTVESFTPPFNATAVVEATVSNGHTFVFAISSEDADSGISIIGNLNPDNCSHLGDCGDPATCGIPANSSIAPNRCFYGIDVKTGTALGWPRSPKLYLTPSLNVYYTVQFSVNASGTAEYSISEGGKVLGTSSAHVGAGPFYVILGQEEGSPDSSPGPNQAYWKSAMIDSPLPPSMLRVYPTEPSYANITLDYKDEILSPRISVSVADSEDLPEGLNVTLREKGETDFNKSLDVLWNPTGNLHIEVNVTLDCVVGKCMQPGGTHLPMNFTVTITASSGSYRQNSTIALQLLKAKWLVMLYCASDGELQGDMKDNVIEMADASKENHDPAVGVLVLFYAYTSTDFQNEPQSGGSIALYKIVNGSIDRVGGVWPETDIKDPATLHKFLNVSMAMDPADHNQLILSDHGGGMEGFGIYDETSMSVTQLAAAFDDISPKLDIVSFDACLMAQAEALYQLEGDASYFTASERSVPGPGYNYTGFLDSLLQNPDQTTGAYLNEIVSTYGAKYSTPEDEEAEEVPTLAAINSSKLEGVVQGLDILSGALVQSYEEHDVLFNKTMVEAIASTVRADDSFPYFDIRSFAENILASPQMNESITTAAKDLIADVKEAVIANTSTAEMYEGLTVFLPPSANFPKEPYQFYTGLESQLNFSDSADWLPLLQSINRSQPGGASWTLLELLHPGHQLYLSVYDSAGGHTGFNPSLLNMSREAIDVIPGSYYFDFNDGTALIILPSSMQNFRVVVDGAAMEEASEQYTLAYTVVQNGAVTSAKTVQGTISQYALQSAAVTIQKGVLAVGATTVSTSTTSTTSSTSSTSSTTTGSTTLITTPTSSTSSKGGGGIPEFPLQAGFVLLATVVIVVSYALVRRIAPPRL